MASSGRLAAGVAETTIPTMKNTDLTHPPARPHGGPPGTAIPRGAPMPSGGPPAHDLLVLNQRPDLSPQCFGRPVHVGAVG
jgi:hypothetical protein